MSTSHVKVDELLMRKRDLQDEIRRIDHELVDVINHFEGSLIDALKMGLIRLNFTAPPGFRQFLNSK